MNETTRDRQPAPQFGGQVTDARLHHGAETEASDDALAAHLRAPKQIAELRNELADAFRRIGRDGFRDVEHHLLALKR